MLQTRHLGYRAQHAICTICTRTLDHLRGLALFQVVFGACLFSFLFPLNFTCAPLHEELCTGNGDQWMMLPTATDNAWWLCDCRRRNQWQPGCTMHRIHLDDCCLFHSFMRHARCECRHFCAEEKGAFWLMLVIRVSKAALALTHDIDGTFLLFCHIPRWSSGQDFALSPRRPGFDSPSGNV